MCHLTVADILTTKVNCLHPDATIESAFQALSQNNDSCCLIAADNGVPLGIITEQCLLKLMVEKGSDSSWQLEPVSSYMISPPFSLPKDTPLTSAMNWIEKRNLRYLLVTEVHGQFLGILTDNDILKAYNRIMCNKVESLENTLVKSSRQIDSLTRELMTSSLVEPGTGLGNRRAMEIDIIKVQAAGVRHRRAYSVALFDIDYLKLYNEHYGYTAGDRILALIAAQLQKEIRGSDSLYQYNSDKYLMVMQDTHNESALTMVQRIVKKLSAMQIAHEASPFKHITISAGIGSSHYNGQPLASWRQVVDFAEEGLTEAKNTGRNRVYINQRNTLKVVG